MKKALSTLCLALFLGLLPLVASAQSTTSAAVSAPDTEAFPILTAFLDVRDGAGRFVSGLTAADMQVLENSQEIRPLEVEEIEPGMQMALAISPSPTFAVRDSNGLTRFDYINEAILNWANVRSGSRLDDLSIFTINGPTEVHLDSYSLWRTALQSTPTDYRNTTPNLQVLAQAIDIAADPAPREGMGKAVLFITPSLEPDTLGAIDSLSTRAQQSNVRVYVWMITSEAFFENEGAAVLRQMAADTGGEFFAYSGTEAIPNLEDYFASLRKAYSFSYESAIVSAGEHTLTVEVDALEIEVTSNTRTFELAVLPPNPIFVSPPTQVYRALSEDENGELTILDPVTQPLEILIEFPDGYERELLRTTLYVNGEIAAENTAPPFDQFDWDLSGITETGEFRLQVEAVDTRGLSSISLETPVDVTVQRPPEGFVPAITRSSPILATVLIVIAGGILIFVLIRVGRKPDKTQQGNGNARAKEKALDPVYQEVDPDQRPRRKRRLPRWARQIPTRFQWSGRAPRGEPLAFLERIFEPDSLDALTPTKPIEIKTSDLTLGTDPQQAMVVLEDLSVEDLHARLHRDREGQFYLTDNDSIAGTWVNYMPTNGNPVRVEHGDLLHFGRVGFRFRLNQPPKVFAPLILPGDKSN